MKKSTTYSCCCGSPVCWGIFLVLIGGFAIAKSKGWIPSDTSIWPWIFIGVGAYLLIKNYRKKSE